MCTAYLWSTIDQSIFYLILIRLLFLHDIVYAFSFYCSIKLFKNICDPVLRAVVSKGEGASSPCNCLCLMRMIDIVAQLCIERIVVVGIKHDEMYSIA